ncbi:MAG: pyridoxamine 5'-phosphate oxidase [Holosporales bacterium]|jgi:pyridoxamine 5'-phosphate oxidase
MTLPLDVTGLVPLPLFEQWFAEAAEKEPNDPNAMALATVDAGGRPSVRMVLLKGLDDRGFVFYTNDHSRKAQALAAHPVAALLFHWKSLRRQVRVEGHVERTSAAEADAYFASRPRVSQLGAWASDQSAILPDRGVFEQRLAAVTAQYEGSDVPRPPHWGGWRVVPHHIEFWHDMPYRLHDRVVFERVGDDARWTAHRLYP